MKISKFGGSIDFPNCAIMPSSSLIFFSFHFILYFIPYTFNTFTRIGAPHTQTHIQTHIHKYIHKTLKLSHAASSCLHRLTFFFFQRSSYCCCCCSYISLCALLLRRWWWWCCCCLQCIIIWWYFFPKKMGAVQIEQRDKQQYTHTLIKVFACFFFFFADVDIASAIGVPQSIKFNWDFSFI